MEFIFCISARDSAVVPNTKKNRYPVNEPGIGEHMFANSSDWSRAPVPIQSGNVPIAEGRKFA